ncbi:hypothetical protein [Paenibacillus wynnii]|uniref:hypothetical protein n=1 Tax=Paenibacillus wynnii TaxID=268407 RepID=UPI00278D247F|nr:hypothetical protein [Paenibacillus wynnii]MDQ0193599.1 hypothetical protein [Paenibacillus wynnii]
MNIMKQKLAMFVRIVFGIILLGIGLVNLSGMMPAMQYPEPANTLMNSFITSGYIMVIVSLLKVIVGLSMLSNRFVPLALILFMPISVNMILFHAFLNFQGILPALMIGSINIYLLFVNREMYKPLLKSKKITMGARE